MRPYVLRLQYWFSKSDNLLTNGGQTAPHLSFRCLDTDNCIVFCWPDLIFVAGRRARPVEKNLPCGEISNSCTWQVWGNLKFLHMWIKFTFLHITDVEKSEISLIMCTIYGILLNFTLFFCIFCNLRCFVVKSVCRDLRAVVWRKFDPKIVPVEKKWQISGMSICIMQGWIPCRYPECSKGGAGVFWKQEKWN